MSAANFGQHPVLARVEEEWQINSNSQQGVLNIGSYSSNKEEFSVIIHRWVILWANESEEIMKN